MKSKLRILACALACLLQSAWAQAEEADRGQDLARADGSRIRFYLDQRDASA